MCWPHLRCAPARQVACFRSAVLHLGKCLRAHDLAHRVSYLCAAAMASCHRWVAAASVLVAAAAACVRGLALLRTLQRVVTLCSCRMANEAAALMQPAGAHQ